MLSSVPKIFKTAKRCKHCNSFTKNEFCSYCEIIVLPDSPVRRLKLNRYCKAPIDELQTKYSFRSREWNIVHS